MTVDLRNACTEDVSNTGSFEKASTGTESVPVYAFRSLVHTVVVCCVNNGEPVKNMGRMIVLNGIRVVVL